MAEAAKKDAKSKKDKLWKGIKTEYNKIAWPDRTETVKESVAVLFVSVVLGLIITFLDTIILFGVDFLTNIGM